MGLPLIRILPGNWLGVDKNFRAIKTHILGPTASPTYTGLTLSGLTASRLVSTNASKALASVTDLTAWIAGVANEIDITDDGDGTVTIGIVNPLIVAKGGTGAATLTDHSILLGSGTDAITALGAATDGQLPIGSTGLDPVLATITGTTNRITVTNAAGSITLTLPQDYHTGASPTLADLTLSTPVNIYALSHDSFADFVANEHIDHTAVTLTAGVGLSGGGDISSNRTFTVDLNELATETAIASGDFIAMVDITDDGSGKITFANFEGTLNHDSLTGFVSGEHFLQTAITNVSTALATGLLKVTTGTGELSVITDASANWNTAYNDSPTAIAFNTADGVITITQQDAGTLTTVSLDGRYYTEAEIAAGYQPLDAGLTSLAGLTYASDSFIKVTATDTYAIRTIAETKTDLSLNLVENTAISTWAGSANITTLGTIGTGTWQGTSISTTYTDAKCTDATADNTAANETSHADVVVDGDFSSAGLCKTDGAGSYSVITDGSTNWDAAYGWGDHASGGYLKADGSVTLAGAWDMGSQVLTNVNIDSGVITGITDLAIADGGTGQSTQQAAIDALTNVAAATNEHVLTKDTATGNAIFKAAAGGGGADVKAAIDSGATADYVGAASSDGFLRTGTSLSYTDGGNYVTLDAIQDIRTTATPAWVGASLTTSGATDCILNLATNSVIRYKIGVDHSDSTKFMLTAGSSFPGTAGICINTSGQVGIGTTTPGAICHIQPASGDAACIVRATGANDAVFQFGTDNTARWTIGVDDDASEEFCFTKGAGAIGSDNVLTLKKDPLIDCKVNVAIRDGNELRFFDSGNSNYVGFEAPALTANKIWILPTADGTSNQVLKTDGSGTLGWMTLGAGGGSGGIDNISSQSTLAADFTITSTSFEDTGLSVSLPSAGTYLVFADVRATIVGNASGYVVAEFYNSTDTADVANSETIIVFETGSQENHVSASINMVITVAAAKTIKLYAKYGGTLTTKKITSDANGRTRMGYIQLT